MLGFICADGNLIKNKRGAHFIAIYSIDYDLLFDIKRAMKSEHKISHKKGGNGNNYCIQIGSKEMFEDLAKLNVFPNKTKRLQLSPVPPKFWFSFLRGYFDGDGNVWVGYAHKESKKPNLTIRVVFTSCSRDFLEAICDTSLKYFPQNGVISKGNGNCYRLTYAVFGALNLYKNMYNSKYLSLYLGRKKVVFEKYIKNKEEMNNLRA
ncbi:MAG: LAGLIDADG family homing endonuclease [bacterium]